MAVVKNLTPDVLALFRADAPPVHAAGCGECKGVACNEVEVRDENFVDRAWPKSTWGLVKKPGKPYVDASTEDAHLFTTPEPEPVADTEEIAS